MAQRSELYAALAQKCGFEVVQENEQPGKLRVLGRCPDGRWNFWALVMHRILTDMPAGGPWSCDISKPYMLRNNKLIFGWRIIVQSKDLPAAYAAIIKSIKAAPLPDRVELESQLLPGHKPGDVRGGFNEKGKGTGAAGSVPKAISRAR